MPEEKEKPKPIVSEDEIERIIKELEKKEEERKIVPPSPPKKHPFKTFFKYCFLFIFLFLLFYLGLNYQSVILQAKYLYKTQIKGQAPPSSITGEINLIDTLIIPKIQVSAPIIWEIEQKDILEKLKQGVVHFKGSALPSEEGNVVMTGHSSSYPWQKGKYDQVFALLDKLTPSDTILIVYNKERYYYEVTGKKIIKPDDLKILTNKESSLTLISCWPLGTSFRRLVVFAQQTEKPPKSLPEGSLPTVP